MKTVFHIKNMVCDRCKMIVSQSFEALGATLLDVELGVVTIASDKVLDHRRLGQVLEGKGFELMSDKTDIIIEQVKAALIDFVDSEKSGDEINVSVFLSGKINREYSYVSKLFSRREGISIEKYVINLKTEKAKELIQMKGLNFSEIAYALGYKSSSHLARQFKSVTGYSMTEYRNMGNWERKSLDQIV